MPMLGVHKPINSLTSFGDAYTQAFAIMPCVPACVIESYISKGCFKMKNLFLILAIVGLSACGSTAIQFYDGPSNQATRLRL